MIYKIAFVDWKTVSTRCSVTKKELLVAGGGGKGLHSSHADVATCTQCIVCQDGEVFKRGEGVKERGSYNHRTLLLQV